MAPIIIDNETKLKSLLDRFAECIREEKDQLVFIDIEGVNLSRLGQVAIMQILMPPIRDVYLVDIHVLGEMAFDLTSGDDISLRSILESKNIFKVFFDVRNDSDALYAHFGVNLDGVIDLQLIEYAVRRPRGKFVNGLAKCIKNDLPYIPDWSLNKEKGRRLFAPELGGRYEVFLQRPLDDEIIKYCEQDVILMPRLLAFYGKKLSSGVAAQLPSLVDARISSTKSSTYNGTGRHMAVGPNMGSSYLTNSSSRREVDIICSDQLDQLCSLHDVVDRRSSTDRFEDKEAKQSASPGSDIPDLDRLTLSEMNSAAITSTTSVMPISGIRRHWAGRVDHNEFDEDDGEFRHPGYSSFDDDNDEGLDFTACSADDCGYCGKCDY